MSARVARVCVDSPLPHLDRLFDYTLSEKFDDLVVGTRVRVPFAGRLVSAVVVDIGADTDFAGTLASVRSAAAYPSYTARSLAFSREVADWYGGSLWDVLRLAAPARVAAVEKREWPRVEPSGDRAEREAQRRQVVVDAPDAGRATVSEAFVDRVIDSWRAAHDGTVVAVVPDARGLARVEAALEARGLRRWSARADGDFAVVRAGDGDSPRYGAYLAGLSGTVRLVIGNRPTVMQPVPRLAAVHLWDDGKSGYRDAHAPYPHARTVATLRAEREGAACVLSGYVATPEALALVDAGWAALDEPGAAARTAAPAVEILDTQRRERDGASGRHWLPPQALRSLRAAAGRCFVLVPRAGYVTALACAAGGEWAVCRDCGGPLRLAADGAHPHCDECDKPVPDWHCAECGSPRAKHVRQGCERIAEQLARMLPDRPVVASSAATGVLDDGAVTAGVVVATPGALPAGSYACGVIVDADRGLGAAGDEADVTRLYVNAAALVAPRDDGGRLVVVGDLPDAARRSLSAWSPTLAAAEVMAERRELRFPPFRRLVDVEGATEREVREVAVGAGTLSELPGVDVAPLPDGRVRVLVVRSAARAVVEALRLVQMRRSHEGQDAWRLRVDGPLRVDQ